MSRTRQPDDPHRSRALTLERFERLLDALGGAPERWPDTEREAAQRLIEQSAAARARWEEATELDRLLDSVPAEPPSPALTARVLAAAPRRPAAWIWRQALTAAVPLAAAAAVTLWLAAR
jgi:ferric-dicitrate binding protein FerR (iron transport regulator)